MVERTTVPWTIGKQNNSCALNERCLISMIGERDSAWTNDAFDERSLGRPMPGKLKPGTNGAAVRACNYEERHWDAQLGGRASAAGTEGTTGLSVALLLASTGELVVNGNEIERLESIRV
ncbi:hypothetical protein SESBI_46300 [Sesbania bispinosa]|nr:hypothetical protein SESBI_46300 [Sesbania bispinosa]